MTSYAGRLRLPRLSARRSTARVLLAAARQWRRSLHDKVGTSYKLASVLRALPAAHLREMGDYGYTVNDSPTPAATAARKAKAAKTGQ